MIYLFILGFCFGVSFILNRLATTNGFPFILYVIWLAAGAALIGGFAGMGDLSFPFAFSAIASFGA